MPEATKLPRYVSEVWAGASYSLLSRGKEPHCIRGGAPYSYSYGL